MSDAQSYLLTVDVDKGEAVRIAQSTAKKLEDKQLKLLEVVQSLGEYLTDEDATIRAKAIAYFSAILVVLRPDFLTRQQIEVNIQFFSDRIRDESGLREAVEGLGALQRCTRFTEENAVQIVTSLFTNTQDLQRHPQGTRFVVFSLLDAILSSQRQALRGMGDDFIVGITDLVSGEKDPRNLMIIFSMLRVVMVEWDISRKVSVMFDSVFCYFPITFRPPPDDPYGITAQDLKTRLRDCLASTPYFAGLAFPSLLDKLDSTSPNVKKDVLQTITACAQNYNSASVASHSTQLWDSMKFEILNAQDDDLAREALAATHNIAKCLTDEHAPSSLARFVKNITSECNEQLREPQQKQSKPAGQILEALATASSSAYVLVIKSVLPPLLTLYQDAGGELNKQRALLEVLSQLYDAALIIFGTRLTAEAALGQSNPLDAFRDQLYELASRALMATPKEEISYRVTAVQSFLRLVKLRGFLTAEEIISVVVYLDEIILTEGSQGKDAVKNEALQALIEISRFRPDLISDVSFPAFMVTLPDKDVEDDQTYLSSLEYLAKLGAERGLVRLFLRRLTNKFFTVLRSGASTGYANAILETLLYALKEQDLQKEPDLESIYTQFVVPLLDVAFKPRHDLSERQLESGPQQLISPESVITNDESVLDSIGQIAAIVIRALPQAIQRTLTRGAFFKPLSASNGWMSIPRDARRTEIVSTYLLAALRPQIPLSQIRTTPGSEPILTALINDISSESDATIRLALLRQLSLLINKWLISVSDDELLTSSSSLIPWNALDHNMSDISGIGRLQESALLTIIYISKALILRASPATSTLLPRLLSLLSHPQLGLPTARCLALLLSPDPIISRDNHATIRLLHKQRLFTYCVPYLVSTFRTTADSVLKPNYLIALSGLLANVPIELVLPHLDDLVPLLLQSLDLPSSAVKLATIETLTVTIRETPAVLETHINSLIARLMRCAEGRTRDTPPVSFLASPRLLIDLTDVVIPEQRARLLALHCLALFPKCFRHELLRSQQREVVKRLMSCLDDTKREVRKAGVDCRRGWEGLDDVIADI